MKSLWTALVPRTARRLSGSAFALMLACAIPAMALADVVNLKNGDRLSGKVDSISGEHLVIVTEYAGNVAVDLAAIAGVETDGAFEMRLIDGSSISGTLVHDGETQGVAQAGGVVTPIELERLSVARENRLGLTSFAAEWTSRADLAAEVSRGNSDTDKFNTLIETQLKREHSSHKLSLLVSQENAESDKTKDQVDANYGYKRYLTEQWYASGNAQYFQDPLKDIDSRITVGAGMGYQFWDDSLGALSSDLGVSYVMEEVAGSDENNPALRWGVDYNRWLFSKRLEFFHKQSVLALITSDPRQILQTSTGLRLAVNSSIDTSVRLDVNYETDPPDGAQKTDTTLNFGVGLKF